MKRVHLLVFGDVQGVGFRSWARWQAQELGLVGCVRNREDGISVEIVAEGPQDALNELVKRCQRGPEAAWVEKTDTEWRRASGEFTSFEVR